ncbi:ASCH domain-containing protein [Cellulomonas palmilytica]|uniref:ASCH domain-containing protein n=1 Tax=Cellulomonas palmilytica TaxID=2608402 RepID=UPI001F191A9E|nr:ASCH domain-containing protein [Cellulomonas palmilytica]UJP41385.1 ASCH domain-containing protein [Cellulomonas palmilytica]
MSEHDEGVDEHAEVASDGDHRITAFWQAARGHVGFGKLEGIIGSVPLDVVPPPSFSYGSGAEADDAAREILAGRRTRTTSARGDFAEGADLPRVGDLAIVLDSLGEPRALVRTTQVTVTDEVVDESYELVYPTHGPTPPVD